MPKIPRLQLTINANATTLSAQPLQVPLPSNYGDCNRVILRSVSGTVVLPIGTIPPSMLIIASTFFMGERAVDSRYRTIDTSDITRSNSFPHFAIPLVYGNSIVVGGNIHHSFSWEGERVIEMPLNQKIKLMNQSEDVQTQYFILKQDTVSGINIGNPNTEAFPAVALGDGKAFFANALTFCMDIERDKGQAMVYDQGRTALNHITPTF